jgi:hypothetical protein
MQEIKYQIFEITLGDGQVRRPMRDKWHSDRTAYKHQYFNSPEEANDELNKDERTGDYVILPVSTYLH